MLTNNSAWAYNGSNCLASYSWRGGALTPDNWLISPQFTPTGELELSWYASVLDAAYPNDFYSVYISTTGTDIEDFDTLVFEGTPTPKWRRQAVDLSEYDGQPIYVAFRHHESTDELAIGLDLILVDEPLVLTPNEALSEAVDGGDGFVFYDYGEYPWAVFADDTRSYAYSTNSGVDFSSSSFFTVVELEAGEIFEFNYMVSSELDVDRLVFYVNDVSVFTDSGDGNEWDLFSYIAPTAGEYNFTWSFEKDGSDFEGEDTAYIDNVKTNGFANCDVDEALNVEGGTLEFVNDGDFKWAESSIDGRTVAINTNQGVNNSECVVSTTIELQPGDIFAFDAKVSSEELFDGLVLYIDGTGVWGMTGEVDWETIIFVNDSDTAGTFNVEFIYVKDISSSEGLDTAWLDNVYAGPTPELTGIEFKEDSISVPVGFAKQINVLPMPVLAQLSEITFASDNEKVASVNEDGFVTGIAAGEAKITATTEENFTAEITVTVVDGKFAIGNTVWHEDESRVGWNVFELEEGETELLAETDEIAYDTYAITLVNGVYYGVTMYGELYVLDIKTFEYTLSEQLIENVIMVDLTYNPKTGEFFGLGIDIDTDIVSLYAIDFNNLTTKTITQVYSDSTPMTIASNLEGVLYLIDNYGDLSTIDPATGELTVIGNTGTMPAYVQSMAFDHATGELYWALYQEEMYTSAKNGIPMGGSIVKVDIET
ncbi:MAG: hypothetical protein GX802_04980, partial [Clostridiales bacterium]|nr:hypothetical protein [Clostridiales bacterium]